VPAEPGRNWRQQLQCQALARPFAAEWRPRIRDPRRVHAAGARSLLYGIYYPQPYLNQILRKIPIAVVDNDLSELSAISCKRWMPAAPSRITASAGRLRGADDADLGEAFAVVEIPPGAERDLLKGTTVTFRFMRRHLLFIFRTTAKRHRGRDRHAVRADRRRRRPHRWQPGQGDARQRPTGRHSAAAIFNPVGGYASYIVPARSLLILQQMLLVGSGMLTVVALAQGVGERSRPFSVAASPT